MTNNASQARVSLEIDWADADNELPSTDSVSRLTNALKREIRACVKEGVYPASTKLERYISGGLLSDPGVIIIEVSCKNREEFIEFYTAYCGGDEDHALSELEEMGL